MAICTPHDFKKAISCGIVPRMTKQLTDIQKTALSVTRWVGSPVSVAIHTILFAGSFALAFTGLVPFDRVLLILTTIVSLEAIYLSIFIQMTINITTETIQEVQEDVEEISEDMEEIQKDVEEMSEDVEEIQKDVDEIQKDVEEMSEDVEEMSEDVEEIQKDVDELQEDVEEISEEDAAEEAAEEERAKTLAAIQGDLHRLLEDIEKLKR
ncbi:DUF1003 domain-containing protein [Candidatus Kaiserbacteria bacterium]|nr:DUF1003 domain-containing protein [Candidatus Kaiserbacteria bacterium]